MKDEEMAEELKQKAKNYAWNYPIPYSLYEKIEDKKEQMGEVIEQAFLDGLKTGRPQWHKIFESEPYNYEYWDLPQDRLPKIENFYFVKLKNGFIKICELKYDHWSGKKHFYDLHGGKQSNVAEWLDYPTFEKE